VAKERDPQPPQRCLNCQQTDFEVEEGRTPTKWGGGTHLLRLYVCTACGFVHQFYRKRSLVTD
jgi:hypothetical protein